MTDVNTIIVVLRLFGQSKIFVIRCGVVRSWIITSDLLTFINLNSFMFSNGICCVFVVIVNLSFCIDNFKINILVSGHEICFG